MYLSDFSQLTESQDTFVLPDATSAAALRVALECRQRAGAPVWRPPQLLAWPAAVRQAFDEAELAPGQAADDLFVLSAEQALAVWQQLIFDANNTGITYAELAAPSARQAWQTARLWQVDDVQTWPSCEDHRLYRNWSSAWQARCRQLGALDTADLLDRARPGAKRPRTRLHGFVDVPPGLGAFFAPTPGDACPPLPAMDTAAAYVDRGQELAAAFEWAFETAATQAGASVVVALYGLAQAAGAVRRAARDVYGDAHGCYIAAPESIVGLPAVQTLIGILELESTSRWDILSAVMRSPAIAAARQERGARSTADLRLRSLERFELPLEFVEQQLARYGGCEQFSAALSQLRAIFSRMPVRQRMVDWLQHFDDCLSAFGWPDTAEDAAAAAELRQIWSELSDRLLPLDAVLAPLSREQALARVRRLVHDTPQSTALPQEAVFVVTPEQALALRPSHVWLAAAESGFMANQRPAPFLPIAAQRQAGVPGADPGRDLARARSTLAALGTGAEVWRASYATGDGEQHFMPTPLIPALAQAIREPARVQVPRAWRQPGVILEQVTDTHGVALQPGTHVSGGTGFLAAQSACAFRAYARHRLSTAVPEEPRPGLSPRARGTAIHSALVEVWAPIGDAQTLRAMSEAERRAVVRDAVNRALRPRPFQTALERAILKIEQERVCGLLEAWLETELRRDGFTVVDHEAAQSVDFGGLVFDVRIDRIDRLEDGSVTIVDYKTGQCAKSEWETPRMMAPQLPFYALTAETDRVDAVAFAQLRPDQQRWLQLPAEIADRQTWLEYVSAWQIDLEQLSAAIRAADAAALPRDPMLTCRNCEQALFCRLTEHAAMDIDGDDDASG